MASTLTGYKFAKPQAIESQLCANKTCYTYFGVKITTFGAIASNLWKSPLIIGRNLPRTSSDRIIGGAIEVIPKSLIIDWQLKMPQKPNLTYFPDVKNMLNSCSNMYIGETVVPSHCRGGNAFMGSPTETSYESQAQSKRSHEQTTAESGFPKFHELLDHPKTFLSQALAGPEAGLQAAKHAFVEKAHGAIQLGEELANGASNSAIGRDLFSKEQLASYGPQAYKEAMPYSYNWYFEQIGVAAPMVVASAIGSRFMGNAAAQSLRSMEKVSAASLTLDAHNLAFRPSPLGMNFTHAGLTGFASEFISPIVEPAGDDSVSDAVGQRSKNGLHGAMNMAAMSAGGLAVESVVGNVANSFLKKTAVATVGGGLGGAFSYLVDAQKSGQQLTPGEIGQSFVGAALVGGTFSAVSGKPRIESNENPFLKIIDKEQSGIFDNKHSFARAIAKHIQEGESNPEHFFQDVKAPGLDLRNFDFGNTNLHKIDLSGADLRGADFSKVRYLSQVNFENANLEGAKFSRELQQNTLEPLTAPIVNVNFEGAKLAGADFTNSVILQSSFRRAALTGDTTFDGAYLQKLDFTDSSLRDVDFSKVRVLRDSEFGRADIAGTNFTGRSLSGLNLRDAKNVDFAIFDDFAKKTNGSPLPEEPHKQALLRQIKKEHELTVYKEMALAERAQTLPESDWALPPGDFIKAARWSVSQHADTTSLNGEDPYVKLQKWERAALSVKDKNSWSGEVDARPLGREKFLQDYATTDQVIDSFHPKASEKLLNSIESGVENAKNVTGGNYFGAIKYLKVGELEKQIANYGARTNTDGHLYSGNLLRVVSNLGDNSSRYLQKVERVWLNEQLEEAKIQATNPATTPQEASWANDRIERLQIIPPQLSTYETHKLLVYAADHLTLHNSPVNGKNSLADWFKNVTYQQSEPLRDSNGKATLDENGKQQFSNTIRMRSKADVQMIATNWETIPEADRTQGNFSKLVNLIKARKYPNAVDANFADEAARGGIKLEDFETAQDRYLKSQTVPSPFPLERTWYSKDGSLTGQFISRNDARGIFLGNMTDCCQHPNGPGAKAAWYGQEEANAGFFVVSDSKGNVVAQSLAWVSGNKGLVFDSIEGKGINVGTRSKDVIETYKAVASDLARKYPAITVGAGIYAGNSDLVKNTWKPAGENTQSVPSNLGYTDAKTQYLLALDGVSK